MLALLAAEVAPTQEFLMVWCDSVFGHVVSSGIRNGSHAGIPNGLVRSGVSLVGRQAGCLVRWQHAGRLAAWQASKQAGWVAGRH